MTSKWNQLFEGGGIHTDSTPDLTNLVPILKQDKVKRILDAGCGNGRDSIYLSQQGFDVYAVDSSTTAIQAAKKASLGARINYQVCDLTELPFENEFFDFVLAGHSIEYTGSQLDKVISEFTRVLKKGKPIYLRVLSKSHPFYKKEQNELYGNSVLEYAIRKNITIRYFSEDELRNLFSEFKIGKLEHVEHEPSRKTGVPLNEWILLGYKQ